VLHLIWQKIAHASRFIQGAKRASDIPTTPANGTWLRRTHNWRLWWGNHTCRWAHMCLAPVLTNIIILTASQDTERCIQCTIQRHQKSERSRSRLDHPPRSTPKPPTGTQYQNGPWILSWAHWSATMSCRPGLVQYWVRLSYPHTLHNLTTFRMKEKLQSGEMAVSGDQWPIFLYHGYSYDPEDPWNGLFRGTILVSVSLLSPASGLMIRMHRQAYKYVFTSPSSVEKEPKATRSGNAHIHGMTQVTPASIAYIATQVRT